MQCPKCGAEAYLVDEELIRVVENTDPMKVIAKAIYQCRSCGDRFSRLVIENIDARKVQETQRSQESQRSQGVYSGETFGSSGSTASKSQPAPINPEGDAMDQLRFY